MRSVWGRRIVRSLSIVISLIGLLVSHHLLLMHARVPSAGPTLLDEACTAFATSSCEEVLNSPYAELKFGPVNIPTAQLGCVFFIIALCWLAVIRHVTPSRWPVHLLICLVAGIGLGVCAFLAFKMYGELEKWCPLCAITHVCTLLIFISFLLLWPRGGLKPAAAGRRAPTENASPAEVNPPGVEAGASVPLFAGAADAGPDAPGSSSSPWPTLRAMLVMAVVVLAVTLMQQFYVLARANDAMKDAWQAAYKRLEKEYRRFDRWQFAVTAWNIAPYADIRIEGEPVRGPAAAAHVVTVFSDFQCPTCGKFEEFLKTRVQRVAERYGGVRVVFKHWPISTRCNPHAARDLHPQACLAARAAEAARIVGGPEAFWQMHDLLFERQDQLKKADRAWYLEQARSLGLEISAFEQAMDSREAEERIRAHIEEGVSLGKGILSGDELEQVRVNSTPMVFVDGRPLKNWRHVRTWQLILGSPVRPPPETRPADPAEASAPDRPEDDGHSDHPQPREGTPP